MKAQGMDCKDIGIIIGGKDKHEVKARYKALMAAKDKENAVAGKGETKGQKESQEKSDKEGKKDKGGKSKGGKGGNGKEGKDGKSKDGKEKEAKEQELKSILKRAGKDGGIETPKTKGNSTTGTPVINVFEDDELSKDDVSSLTLVLPDGPFRLCAIPQLTTLPCS